MQIEGVLGYSSAAAIRWACVAAAVVLCACGGSGGSPASPGEDAGGTGTPAGDGGSGTDSGTPSARDAGSGDAATGGGRDAASDAAARSDGGALSYAADVAPILDASCAALCHGACGGLMISYANIINQPSNEQPSLDYIVPKNPGTSYLFCKISPTDPACTAAGTMITGTSMPPFLPPLSAANVATIKTWIEQGALP